MRKVLVYPLVVAAGLVATGTAASAGHQNSAVELTNLAGDGVNPQTRDLAKQIKASRGDQVAQLLRLIGGRA